MWKYLLGAVAVIGIGVANYDGSVTTQNPAPVVQQQVIEQKIQAPIIVREKVETKSQLSNDKYYTNSVGTSVHSPAYSDSVPVGATAKCRDGTYSFSQSRRGTCSRHGGVADWI